MPDRDEMLEFLAYQERRIEEERQRLVLAQIALQEKEERDKAAEEALKREKIAEEVVKEWQEREAAKRQREMEERQKRNQEFKEKLRKELDKMQLPKTQIEHVLEQVEEEPLDPAVLLEGTTAAGSSSGQNKGNSSASTVQNPLSVSFLIYFGPDPCRRHKSDEDSPSHRQECDEKQGAPPS